MPIEELNVAIIDDEKSAIKNFLEEIESIRDPKINVLFSSQNPVEGLAKAKEQKPDILFLDIEMPGMNGIEVLRSLRDNSDFDCHVIFQTSYEKYTIQALREAAFDFIMKPIERPDLCNSINRFLSMKYRGSFRDKISRIQNDSDSRVSLPTANGLCFLQKDEIVAIEYIVNGNAIRPHWEVITYNNQRIGLRRNTKGQDLLVLVNNHDFFMINSAVILNLNYLSMVDYKTRDCVMVPPFNNFKYQIARNKLAKFKERHDCIS